MSLTNMIYQMRYSITATYYLAKVSIKVGRPFKRLALDLELNELNAKAGKYSLEQVYISLVSLLGKARTSIG